VGPAATVLIAVFVVATYFWTDSFTRLGINPGLVPIAAVAVMLAAGLFVARRAMGWAFVMTCLAIALATITIFMSLYPRVMVSSLNPDWSLTIYNASSSPYTLKVMSIVALLFVPVVLVYQSWTYWVFRKRIGARTKLEY
jgi:cytochrome d ubiquinol oxidase subunit II